ncbi:MAG: peptidoglycan DD-metalloendopeptidase family protein [Chromatiales bacterium]|jgi:murein DD-endopeptidase MepM/ murein hydrolase activator NlpD|nr:peptidoglycan DD-metalloendopeptidase family protein [Chromatiales bacterium]MDX9766504.1 peptidoglycan DD-metalloendopeptidase family protein [Ectothiorhodospiraceae bacterium]
MRNLNDKATHPSSALSLPHHWRLRAAFLILGLIVLSVVLARTHEPAVEVVALTQVIDASVQDMERGRIQIALPLPEPVRVAPAALLAQDSGVTWEEITVRRGDTLSSIFSRLEIHRQLPAVLALGKSVADLRSIHPGQRIGVRKDGDGLAELTYEPNPRERLVIIRTDDGFQARNESIEVQTRIKHAIGVIEHSLFLAGQEAGLSDKLIMELAAIFGWDVDFALDIRRGDRFTVIYEEQYQNGERLNDGPIIAAEFVNQGRTYRALRYTTPDGRSNYYNPDGLAMRKAFLRTPVEFSRISSRFGARRHPVLSTMRQHKGVDYAAPTGTPIRSAGDGRIVFRGKKGGYGNVVIIQHGERYRTLYAHMSRFGKSTAVGSRVNQGQIIGYIGMTGMATGPHLHYEFHVNGVHKDPLTVKLPGAEPLPKAQIAEYKARTAPLVAQLDLFQRFQVAAAN